MEEVLNILDNFTEIEPWDLGFAPQRVGHNRTWSQAESDRNEARKNELNGIPTNIKIPDIVNFRLKFKTLEYQEQHKNRLLSLISSLSCNDWKKIPNYYEKNRICSYTPTKKILKKECEEILKKEHEENIQKEKIYNDICNKHLTELSKELSMTFGIEIQQNMEIDPSSNFYYGKIIKYTICNNPDFYEIITELDDINFFCVKGNIVYDTLEKNGLLDRYYPDWWKYGRY